MYDRQECSFHDGIYETRGKTEPAGRMSQCHCGIAEGVQVGLCRLQRDAIRIGPITLFDKGLIRRKPKGKQQQ